MIPAHVRATAQAAIDGAAADLFTDVSPRAAIALFASWASAPDWATVDAPASSAAVSSSTSSSSVAAAKFARAANLTAWHDLALVDVGALSGADAQSAAIASGLNALLDETLYVYTWALYEQGRWTQVQHECAVQR